MFGKVLPPPDEESIASYYVIEKYYTHGFDQHGKEKLREENTASRFALLRVLDKLRTRLAWLGDKSIDIDADWIKNRFGAPGKQFCDIGCGGGYLLGILTRAGYSAVGVEPDPAARRVATERGLKVLEGTAETLPEEISRQRFDVVFMLHALEHCIDPRNAIWNARSLLSPGGVLVVETPNNAALGMKSAGPSWQWLDVPRHQNFFTPESLRGICTDAGLHIEATEYTGYARQFLPEWITIEQRIFDILEKSTDPGHNLPSRNSALKAWWLLLRTALASKERKYDSVRVLAYAPPANGNARAIR